MTALGANIDPVDLFLRVDVTVTEIVVGVAASDGVVDVKRLVAVYRSNIIWQEI